MCYAHVFETGVRWPVGGYISNRSTGIFDNLFSKSDRISKYIFYPLAQRGLNCKVETRFKGEPLEVPKDDVEPRALTTRSEKQGMKNEPRSFDKNTNKKKNPIDAYKSEGGKSPKVLNDKVIVVLIVFEASDASVYTHDRMMEFAIEGKS